MDTVKNGLVLELYEYLIVTLKYELISVVQVLCKMTSEEMVNKKVLKNALARLWKKRLNLVKHKSEVLSELNKVVFKMCRNRSLQLPDTPRKRSCGQG